MKDAWKYYRQSTYNEQASARFSLENQQHLVITTCQTYAINETSSPTSQPATHTAPCGPLHDGCLMAA
jgi:hypothetical protein